MTTVAVVRPQERLEVANSSNGLHHERHTPQNADLRE